jgi:hypothetical protein
VYGNAQLISGSWTIIPLSITGCSYIVNVVGKGQIAIGCKVHTVAEWQKLGKRLAKLEGLTAKELREFKDAFAFAVKWMKNNGVI